MNTLLHENNRTLPQERRSQVFFDGDYGVYREDNFIEMLEFERKRSERSGKPFLLLRLTIFGISELQNRYDTIKGAVEALAVFGRETDIKGWYRRESTLGVIFTEMNNFDLETLRKKLYRSLRAQLTEAQVNDMQMSFHTYPDDGNPVIPSRLAGFTFFPAVSKKHDPNMSPS
jgi:hypothetical protein